MFALMVRHSPQSVIAVFASVAAAEEVVRDLDVGGFPIRQVSLVSRDRDGEGLIVAGSLSWALFDTVEEVLRGAGAGVFLRSLMAWGVSCEEVLKCEQTLRSGKALLIGTGSAQQVARAYGILHANGAIALKMHGAPTALAEKSTTRWPPGRTRGRLVRKSGPPISRA